MPVDGSLGFGWQQGLWNLGSLGEVLVSAKLNVSQAGAPRIYPSPGPGTTTPTMHPLFATAYFGYEAINLFSSFNNPAYDIPTEKYKRPDDENKLYLYRVMREQAGMPEIGDVSLAQLGVRDQDITPKGSQFPNADIFPGDLLGMSVTPWNPALAPYPPSPSKPMWKIHISSLPALGLAFYQDAPDQAIIIPATWTSAAKFRNRVHLTAPLWTPQ